MRRLGELEAPEVSARAMRKRLRDVPAAVPPPEPPTLRNGRTPPIGFDDPRDWRWFVGGLGRILIALGLLIFAFVAYQLWGTGIQYARAQDQLEQDFEEQLAALPTPTAGPVTTLAQVVPSSADDPTLSSVAPADTTAAASTEPASTEAPSASVVELPPLDLGDVLGKIEIPSIGVEDMIVAGVRQSDLDEGVGHYPYTPLPGETGNSAIAGHRTTHGQPFFDLDKLAPGDEIVVTTLAGRFVYSVTDSKVVDPNDFTVLLGDPAESKLTLTTCHPRYSQKKRLVIAAVLDRTESVATPAEITYADDALTPEAQADPAPADTIVGGDSGTVGDGGESGTVTLADQTADAFSNGWFSDPDAWPQIALWGSLLTLVALAATWLGRRTNNWIGAILGIFPFTFVLYFWFENVNRLLPPGL